MKTEAYERCLAHKLQLKDSLVPVIFGLNREASVLFMEVENTLKVIVCYKNTCPLYRGTLILSP